MQTDTTRRAFLGLLAGGVGVVGIAKPDPALPKATTVEILTYGTETWADNARRLRWLAWCRNEVPDMEHELVYEARIERRDGKPYQARFHCFAKDATGQPYLDKELDDVARLPPVDRLIRTEPCPEDKGYEFQFFFPEAP